MGVTLKKIFTDILIVLCGKSPAVITETVYALVNREVPLIPAEIIVITTEQGRTALQEELFAKGIWREFVKKLKLDISFGPSDYSVRVIPRPDNSGNAADISSDAGNAVCADFILNILRQYSENPDTRILFSIAGGRKTMTAVAALSLSMLGRRQDMLCHVLVNPPFDSALLEPLFFYPEKDVKYKTPDGQCYAGTEAEITLCEIPFVRTRYLFGSHLNRLPGTFADTVSLANDVVKQTVSMPLFLDPRRLECRFGDVVFRLNPPEMVLYWMLARRCQKHLPPINGQKELNECFIDFLPGVTPEQMPEIIHYPHLNRKNDEDMRKLIHTVSGKIRRAGMKFNTDISACLPGLERGTYGIKLSPARVTCPDFK